MTYIFLFFIIAQQMMNVPVLQKDNGKILITDYLVPATIEYKPAHLQYGLFIFFFKQEKYDEALKFLQYAAAKGHSDAQYALSNLLEQGKYIRKNHLKALVLLHLAAANNHSRAIVALASLHINGDKAFDYLRKPQRQKGFDILREQTLKGNFDATFLLGQHFLLGRHLKQDFRKGFILIELAADNGLPDAIYLRGMCLLIGVGCKKDRQRGMKDIHLAASLNSPYALSYLKSKTETGTR